MTCPKLSAIKCPWCMKCVAVRRGRLSPHDGTTSRCEGSGQTRSVVQQRLESMTKMRGKS